MAKDDDEVFAKPKAEPRYAIGQSLDAMSIDEIASAVAMLKMEIARLEASSASKQASRAAADSVFALAKGNG